MNRSELSAIVLELLEKETGDPMEYLGREPDPAKKERLLAGTRNLSCTAIFGVVSGREVIVRADDPSIKGGAWYPLTVKKTVRALTLFSMEINDLVTARDVRSPPTISTESTRGSFSIHFRASAIVLRVSMRSAKGTSGSGILGFPPTATIRLSNLTRSL